MIIQGDNKPIQIELSEAVANIQYLSAAMCTPSGKVLKTWGLDDATLDGKIISLPLTQAETLGIKTKSVLFDLKFVADDTIEFVKQFTIQVTDRHNPTIFPIGGES